MVKDDFGNRMKEYENVNRTYLTKRVPVIIRVDGKAFHTFTKGLKKPFDDFIIKAMQETARYLCENIQGCKLAYVQSDEISLLLTDYDTITTDGWFDYNVQKMASVSASMTTLAFNRAWFDLCNNHFHLPLSIEHMSDEMQKKFKKEYYLYTDKNFEALFDSRVYNIPKEEVCNYFLWRQKDATRNSIEAVGQAYFSQKELHKKNCNEIQEMLFERGIDWNSYTNPQKYGSCIEKVIVTISNGKGNFQRGKWIINKTIPIFSENRNYIERLI